jgi:hypothetical protein
MIEGRDLLPGTLENAASERGRILGIATALHGPVRCSGALTSVFPAHKLLNGLDAVQV